MILSSYHIIRSSYHHIIISSFSKKNCKSVLGKSQQKNRNSSLNPFTKERRDLKFGTSGVIFRGESAGNAQKIVASPKRAIFDFMLTFCSENFIQKKILGVENSNVGNHLKRVLPKFQAERSHVRGVNGRSKF